MVEDKFGKAVTRAGAALGDKIGVSKKNTYSNKYEFNGNDEYCRLIISQDIYNVKEYLVIYENWGSFL
ncbi:MAG: hypothetical protein E7180_04265 [Erysipelotrichaceae bacterium]|nr:hypothetical protein [Erysipelotrichaceae bacterium]